MILKERRFIYAHGLNDIKVVSDSDNHINIINKTILFLLLYSFKEYRCIITVVECDDVQAVQQLSLILVDPLHLDIEHGVRIDLHLIMLLQMCRKFQFIFLKDKQIKESTAKS